MLIISSVAAVAFAASMAQDRPLIWFENRTTQGCVFYKMIYDPGDAPITLPEYTWSGRCESGRPIGGAGVLEKKYTYTSSMSVERETGTMVDGYWHGPVRSELFRSENGGPLKPESYSDGSWMPTRQSTYDMGCGEAWQERGQCLQRPDRAAAEPPGQRIYDTPEEYGAARGESGSRSPQPSPPIGTSTGFSAAFLDPSGRPCVTAEAMPTRSTPIYWDYRIRFTNICGRSFRIRLETIPHPEKEAEVKPGVVYANSTSSEFGCLERRNGSAQLTSCVGGFARWWLITTGPNPEESAAQEAPRPPSR